jgi:hypothetical protein
LSPLRNRRLRIWHSHSPLIVSCAPHVASVAMSGRCVPPRVEHHHATRSCTRKGTQNTLMQSHWQVSQRPRLGTSLFIAPWPFSIFKCLGISIHSSLELPQVAFGLLDFHQKGIRTLFEQFIPLISFSVARIVRGRLMPGTDETVPKNCKLGHDSKPPTLCGQEFQWA